MPGTVSSARPGSGTHGLERGNGGSEKRDEPEGSACAANSREERELERPARAEDLRNNDLSGGPHKASVTVGAIKDVTETTLSGARESVVSEGERPQCRGCTFFQKQIANLVKVLREDDSARYKEEAKVATAKVQRLKVLLVQAAAACEEASEEAEARGARLDQIVRTLSEEQAKRRAAEAELIVAQAEFRTERDAANESLAKMRAELVVAHAEPHRGRSLHAEMVGDSTRRAPARQQSTESSASNSWVSKTGALNANLGSEIADSTTFPDSAEGFGAGEADFAGPRLGFQVDMLKWRRQRL